MARQLYSTEFVQLAGTASPAPNLPFTVWTDLTAGSNVTSQILGPDGLSLYTAVTDSQGNIAPFRGPDGYMGNLFVDTGASYRFMLHSPTLIDYLVQQVLALRTQLASSISDFAAAVQAAGGGAGGGAVSSVAGKTGAVTLVKADVGLGNVDNTSDATKPLSTAAASALAAKAGLVAGLIPLDLVPAGYTHSVSYATAMAAVSRSAITSRSDIRIRIEGGLNTDPLPTWMLDWDYQDAVPA
jgi:hypothetical protein